MASNARFSVCKHEGRENENDKVFTQGKQCREQWLRIAATASNSPMAKETHKIS